MENQLIQFKTSWADEIDFVGFHVISLRAWEFFKALLPDKDFPLTIGVGSNQEIRYETPDKFWECFTVQPVSKVTATILKNRFELPFGEFPLEQIIQGIIDDEPEREVDQPWLIEEVFAKYE